MLRRGAVVMGAGVLQLVTLASCSRAPGAPAKQGERESEARGSASVPAPEPAQMALRSIQQTFGTKGEIGPLPADRAKRVEVVRRFVRDAIAQDSFFTTILPRLFIDFNIPPAGQFSFYLHRTEVNGRTLYYGLTPNRPDRMKDNSARPCDPATAVEVQPWWDLHSKVLVCPDDYRPDVTFHVHDGKPAEYCEALPRFTDGAAEGCGCGRHLLHCIADFDLDKRMKQAIRDEATLTMQSIVQRHQRFSTAFTGNASIRSPLAEFFYARSRFFAGRDATLQLPSMIAPEATRAELRPRDRGYDGGVFTMQLYRNGREAVRSMILALYDDALCMPLPSLHVTSAEIFRIQDPDLRLQAQMPLTTMAGCKECHARMENGLVAFRTFTSFRDSLRYMYQNEKPERTTRFYGRDSNDVRAEGPATPRWFTATAVAQPEFAACQSRKVLELVYGGQPYAQSTLARLEEQFRGQEDLANLFEEAVVARIVEIPETPPVAAATELVAEIENTCADCHGVSDDAGSLDNIARDPDLALHSALRVAANEMPPAGLSPERRTSLVLALCRAGGVNDADCNRNYLPTYSTGPVSQPKLWMRTARAELAGDRPPAAADKDLDPLVERSAMMSDRIIRGSPTIEASLVAFVVKLCGDGPDAAPCIDNLLNNHQRWIPAP